MTDEKAEAAVEETAAPATLEVEAPVEPKPKRKSTPKASTHVDYMGRQSGPGRDFLGRTVD